MHLPLALFCLRHNGLEVCTTRTLDKVRTHRQTIHRGVAGFFLYPSLAVVDGTFTSSLLLVCTALSLRDPPSPSSITKMSFPSRSGAGAGDGRSTGPVIGETNPDCRLIVFFAELGGDILDASFTTQGFWLGMMGTGISCKASQSLCFSSAACPSLSD